MSNRAQRRAEIKNLTAKDPAAKKFLKSLKKKKWAKILGSKE